MMRRPLRLAAWLLACLFLSEASEALPAEDLIAAMAQRAEVRYTEVPRAVLAFYYPWYGNPEVQGGSGRWAHWSGVQEDRKEIATSTHFPVLGPYDSHDPELIAKHCAWAKQAGVDGWIVSWWGLGSFSDRAMRRILDAAKEADLDVTAYYETVPEPGTPDAAAGDVLELLDRYADHPAWLRVDGKPVVFVYGRAVGQLGVMGWLQVIEHVHRKRPGGVAFIGDQFNDRAAYVFDGLHTYNTAGALRGKGVSAVCDWAKATYPRWVEMAESRGRISTLTVIPGYDDTKIREPGLAVERYDGASYRCQWAEALAADPDWVLITSWNEWHEGSEIEPSVEYGEEYLELTADFSARFKNRPPSPARAVTGRTDGIDVQRRLAGLESLAEIQVGLLPDPDPAVLWPLLKLPKTPELLSWQDVASLGPESAERMPILVYTGGEDYRQTASEPGDVDRGLLRHMKAGGLVMVLPNGPMPFHYNEHGKVVNTTERLGLPISVGGPGGGWEEPPEGVDLRFVQPEARLEHLPREFPFPEQGDLRWRPFVRENLGPGGFAVPLLELRDGRGRHYGDAVAYMEHRAGELKSGRIVYAWFGLLQSPHREAVLLDLFDFAGRKVRGEVE